MKALKEKLKEGLEKRIYNEDEFIDDVVNFQKDTILNRLKEQYKTVVDTESLYSEDIRKHWYQAMRLFCLDTQLLDFNTIELMEFEVNQSFL